MPGKLYLRSEGECERPFLSSRARNACKATPQYFTYKTSNGLFLENPGSPLKRFYITALDYCATLRNIAFLRLYDWLFNQRYFAVCKVVIVPAVTSYSA